MSNEIYTSWIQSQSIAVTSLHSLAAGDIWHGDNITNGPLSGRQHLIARIWYLIELAAAATGGDKLEFYVFRGDEHASEIWDGGVGESEAAITTAGAKAVITDNVIPEKTVDLTAGGLTTQKGSFEVKNLTPHWTVGVRITGATAIAASGSRIHYRYTDTEGQV